MTRFKLRWCSFYRQNYMYVDFATGQWRRHHPMFVCFNTILACVGRTDRQRFWSFSGHGVGLQRVRKIKRPLRDLGPFRGNVRTSSIAHWKVRGRLPICHNWTFFVIFYVWNVISGNRRFSEGCTGHFERKFKTEGDVIRQSLLVLRGKLHI